ncbi:aminoglycoside phosphotransferase family protein [Streptomyces sp. NPDC090303]|uniref:aminoglycoside phosphotransferase family protein n=1 Tax=Streptomyces sp. NPDC090303 TaxID=3365960 RepID=UPI00381F7738
MPGTPIPLAVLMDIPWSYARSIERRYGEVGRSFIETLPARIEEFLRRWDLRPTAEARSGAMALVLPVLQINGTPASLKIPFLNEETMGEPYALRAWDGGGSVRLLRHDTTTGLMLLEQLDSSRTLTRLAWKDTRRAVEVAAELLARLTSVRAPEHIPRLGDVAQGMISRSPALLHILQGDDLRLARNCLAALIEVTDVPGNRLLHHDLHFGNVLGAERERWLAIDPMPLAGDPGFDLIEIISSFFVREEVKWRFDLLTEVLELDRDRARAWTLAGILEKILAVPEDGGFRIATELREVAALLSEK